MISANDVKGCLLAEGLCHHCQFKVVLLMQRWNWLGLLSKSMSLDKYCQAERNCVQHMSNAN